MKLIFRFLDTELFLYKNKILSLEIENRPYFYRIVECLNSLSNGEKNEDIIFYNDFYEEVNMVNKTNVIIDYFNIDFNSKKIL